MRNGDDYSSDHRARASVGWWAFLAGAFVGAGVALLMTPQTGSELRGVLQTYAGRTREKMRERGREAWDTAVERGKGYMQRGQETLKQAGRAGREQVESGSEKMKEGGGEAAAGFNESGRETTKKAQTA
jgi:gas vesicle protein